MVGVHALFFDEAMRAAATRDLEQAQRGAANEFVLYQGVRCQGVVREMHVTSAEVTNDYYVFIYLVFFILYCRVGLFSYANLLSKGALQFNKSFYIEIQNT